MFSILGALAFLSLALALWQFILAMRFPLHRRAARSNFAPPVTILKPLKGLDSETAHCLRSWLEQDYAGPMQLLFGVVSAEDPVRPVVEQLIASHPQVSARLVICPDLLGANPKVSTLIQLRQRAQHELLVLSDADVCVPGDFLTQIVAPLEDPETGLVHCFYRLDKAGTLAMRLEAFAVNADFWGQVLQAQSIGRADFALGAALATSQTHLARAGGFEALADFLADDYQLGNRIAGTGARIVLCPVVVECRQPPLSWREIGCHQLRWARTIRASRPWAYFLSILGNATLWPLLWWVASPFLAFRDSAALAAARANGVALAAGSMILARMITGALMERKMTGNWDWTGALIAPTKDLLGLVLWTAAFCANRVCWRGQRLVIEPGGKLSPPDA